MWVQVDGQMRHPVLNLSEGGLFLLTDQPLAVGRELRLELPLADRMIRVAGKVVHATATEEWAGNGIQLTSLATSDSSALHDFLVAAVTA